MSVLKDKMAGSQNQEDMYTVIEGAEYVLRIVGKIYLILSGVTAHVVLQYRIIFLWLLRPHPYFRLVTFQKEVYFDQ